MSVLIKKSLANLLPSIASVEFEGGGKDFLVVVEKSASSKLSEDELQKIKELFDDFYCYNCQAYTHDAFYNLGTMKFNDVNPLVVVHEYYYNDVGQGLDEFDFSGLERIIHSTLSQSIKELEAINKKLDINSITLNGYFSQGGFGTFELNDKRNGLTLKVTKKIEEVFESTVGNYLEDAANIHGADKTIIDEMEIYESEVGVSSISWQDSYQLDPVEDYPK